MKSIVFVSIFEIEEHEELVIIQNDFTNTCQSTSQFRLILLYN